MATKFDLFNETNIAFAALIATLVFSIITYVQTLKINRTNLISNFYNNIFLESLTVKIPQAHSKMVFSNANVLIDADDLLDELDEMLVNCLYFKYTNRKLYLSLISKIHAIQNHIADCSNNTKDARQQKAELTFIDENISAIYKEINKAYLK